MAGRRSSEIALVGHSMGGLVAPQRLPPGRAEERRRGSRRVRHVVSLGHAAHGRAARAGRPLPQRRRSHALPETRPFGAFLRRRSAGIRDLRQGSLVDEDWRDRDPDALRAAACQEVPLLEGATHCFVAATITRSAEHPLGRLIGDCLVLEPSASGRSRTRRIPFTAEHGLHVGGANHFALLNHPAVYERAARLAGHPARPARGRICYRRGMSTTDEYLVNNARYAESFDKGDLPLPPARKVAVVACMDARARSRRGSSASRRATRT